MLLGATLWRRGCFGKSEEVVASHAPARRPRDFRNEPIIAETYHCVACESRQPRSVRKEQSVELGADDGGGGAAVPYVKLEEQQQQYAARDSTSCWWW